MHLEKYKNADCLRVLAEADVLRPNHERQNNVNDKLTKYNYAFTNGNKDIALTKFPHNKKS